MNGTDASVGRFAERAEVAIRLRTEAESLGLSAGDLAVKSGVHRATLYNYLAGTRVPDAVTLQRLASGAGLDVLYIVTGRRELRSDGQDEGRKSVPLKPRFKLCADGKLTPLGAHPTGKRMTPAAIRWELTKAGFSLVAFTAKLNDEARQQGLREVTPAAVQAVVHGNSRSQRIAQRISDVTGLPLAYLWPGMYSCAVDAGQKQAA